MEVKLAGYNCDSEMIRTAKGAVEPSDAFTPEVIVAAYARISRSPDSIMSLRMEAAEEVDKARKSNEKIIFGYGHASVAEHAQFNFDVVNISRLAIEFLERFRLCSFTEKSQRYTVIGEDIHIPAEKDFPRDNEFLALQKGASTLYGKLIPVLLKRVLNSSRQAKEDARYVALLCTTGQLGMTVSARNLEHIIRRCAASPLLEIQNLGEQLRAEVKWVASSLVRHSEATAYDSSRVNRIWGATQPFWSNNPYRIGKDVASKAVELVHYEERCDDKVLCSILHSIHTGRSWAECVQVVGKLDRPQQIALTRAALIDMEFYDAAPREFEHINFRFELTVSASCYAQLKRHRMCTQTVQPYDVSLAPTVPPSITSAGLEEEYFDHLYASTQMYKKVAERCGREVAEYVLTNGHRRRVMVTMNLRELYHFSRMRCDQHAQWDIRNVADQMVSKVKEMAPLTGMLLGGKDQFVEKVREVYGNEVAKGKVTA